MDGLGAASVLGQVVDRRRLRHDHPELGGLARVVEVLVRIAEDVDDPLRRIPQQVQQRQPPDRVEVLALVDHDRVIPMLRQHLQRPIQHVRQAVEVGRVVLRRRTDEPASLTPAAPPADQRSKGFESSISGSPESGFSPGGRNGRPQPEFDAPELGPASSSHRCWFFKKSGAHPERVSAHAANQKIRCPTLRRLRAWIVSQQAVGPVPNRSGRAPEVDGGSRLDDGAGREVFRRSN